MNNPRFCYAPIPGKLLFTCIVVFAFLETIVIGDDWPGFRGVNRDGKSTETSLLKKWPADGPKMLWSVGGLGDGWSSAAISEGSIYITGKIDRDGFLFAFDLDGKLLWKKAYGPEWNRSYQGARCTPTVNDGKLYIMSGRGVVYCYSVKGEKLWSRDVFSEFEGKYPTWGMSECLLADGEKVIASPGGQKASVVALDKNSGEVLWACEELSEASTYCNPRVIEMGPNRILVTMLRDSVAGINIETGKLLWTDSLEDYHTDRRRTVNTNVPVFHEGRIYTTSGYDNGGAMLQLSADGTKIKRLWTDTVLDVHHGHVILLDGYLYGSNWKDNRHGDWACIRWDDAKKMYDTEWNGNKGNIIYANGMFYCWDENTGEMALVPATPEKFEPVSTFKVSPGKGMHWAHPSISDGVLYIRHGEYLNAYDIKAR